MRKTAQKIPATGRDGSRMLKPGEGPYAEVSLLDPDRKGTASYEIVPDTQTRLTRNVRRLTAANPGYMTGPGTNSYLIGPEDGDIAIIDPGPLLDDHIAALLAAPGRIRWIFTTHTHPDHSPAAAVIQARTGATVHGMPAPTVGLHQDQSFMPDIVPAHGDRFTLAGCTLVAVHTPGHASNHLCYLLEEDRLLFTGDHVMQGSTVVINPPDGSMTRYIESLKMIRGQGIDYFAPGHGFLIGAPDDMIELLVRHRELREYKTLLAVREAGTASLEALTPVVYDDVPEFKHPWAARSLLAHLEKLREDGAVVEKDGEWTAL
jgi:glyoxylase-like metal-dependent hydrolase (beta-lactamase superfamily II)